MRHPGGEVFGTPDPLRSSDHWAGSVSSGTCIYRRPTCSERRLCREKPRSWRAWISSSLEGATSASTPDQLKGCRRSKVRTACRGRDRKSTRLNSSHVSISYAVFCLKKKNYKSTHLQ